MIGNFEKTSLSPLPMSLNSRFWFFGLCYARDGIIRDETLIEKEIASRFVNCFRSRTN
ncbi:unknown protein [Microcystis aeruginosa NIES-843]|uniref:Uncharacterized protein n=1 Tax=Microcystis aeruginosa (strain NIES-843 / IAM M-2473) TaxID=449447 RepID=B0JX45_MICAN|nr:unknown protein [Microcystis aeruginosa NIES-843]